MDRVERMRRRVESPDGSVASREPILQNAMKIQRRPSLTKRLGARAVPVVLAGTVVAFDVGCPGSLDDPSRYFTDASAPTSSSAGDDDAASLGVDAAASCPDVPSTVLVPSCGSTGCHGATSPAVSLDLVSPGLASRLVGKPASGGGTLVDPTSPASSVLYTKLGASPPYGSRMPLGGAPLNATTTACVLSWIAGLGASGSVSDAGALAATDAPSVSDSWTPNSVQATVLWLDASKNVTSNGGSVSAWGDRSTFANHAAQSDATTAPSLDPTGVHGLPALKFDETKGTFVSIPDAPSLQWGTGGYLVAIVATNTKQVVGRGHGGGVSTVFAKPTQQTAVEITLHLNFFTAENTDDDSFFHTGMGEGEPGLVSTTTGYNDGAPRLYLAQVDTSSGKTSMALRVNGVQVGSSSGDVLVDVSLPGSPVRIGSTYSQSVQGEVAEVVAMRGTIGSADRGSLESYLMTKYGFSATDGGQ